METGVELDFAIDWASSAKAEASSVFEVMPGWGTVEEEGFWTGMPRRRSLAVGYYLGLGDAVRVTELDRGVEGFNHFLNGGLWKTRFRGMEGAGWVHWSGKTSL